VTDLSAAPVLSDEEAALVAGIVARPDDDLPRLVFADWLEEHSQGERATFIRGQCEVAKRSDARPVARLKEAWTSFDYDSLINIQPWRALTRPWGIPTKVWVVTSTGSSGYARSIAYHRGFPTIIGCTERQWHRWAKWFPGPLVAVCLSDRRVLPWRTGPTPDDRIYLRSEVDPSLEVVGGDGPSIGDWLPSVTGARKDLWPRVREFAGPCTLGRLRELAAGKHLDGVDGT
jgi:uncharacterized protein (TIGR02996 family)